MCGIAGAIFTDHTLNALGDAGVADIARDLGEAMMARGTDATGIARFTRAGRYKMAKLPRPADEFFRTRKGIASGSRAFIVHTRAKTKGDQSNPLNNHPIAYENIIGIHNGWVINDNEMFAKYNMHRHGEVDSEAIFAAIATLGWQKALETMEGTAAVAWFDMSEDRLHLARQDTYAPLFIGHTCHGDTVFASTMAAVDFAMWQMGATTTDSTLRQLKVGGEVSYHLISGDVEEHEFEPEDSYRSFSQSKSWDSWEQSSATGTSAGWTNWSPNKTGNPQTFQKHSDGSDLVKLDDVGVIVGDIVEFQPRGEPFDAILGRIHWVGFQRAEVDLWLDDDIVLRASLPLARLAFIEHDTETVKKPSKELAIVDDWVDPRFEGLEQPGGLMLEDPFDDLDLGEETSPALAEAIEFLAQQRADLIDEEAH